MKVLFVSDVYFPRIGGVSTSIQTFRSALASLEVETYLVAPSYDVNRRWPVVSFEGSHVAKVRGRRVPRDPEDRLMHWRGLSRALGTMHPDIIHIHTPFLAHYAGVRRARQLGIPCIATYHTWFDKYFNLYAPIGPGVSRAVARYLAVSQSRHLDYLIAPSEHMKAVLQNYGVKCPITIIPTGLPKESFEPGNANRFKIKYNINDKCPIMLYVGRMAREKNIDFLIDALPFVLNRIPAARLILVGDGPVTQILKNKTKALGLCGSVDFLGYIEHGPNLRDAYSAADVFVFASDTETQGLVQFEAMAQGLRVVSKKTESLETFAASVCNALSMGRSDASSKFEISKASEYSSDRCAASLRFLYSRLISQSRGIKRASLDSPFGLT